MDGASRFLKRAGSQAHRILKSSLTMNAGLAMMAVGSVASLSVVGAPFGAPLLVTGMAVAGASYITRKHAERQAKKEQPTQDSPQKEHQNASAARRADNPRVNWPKSRNSWGRS